MQAPTATDQPASRQWIEQRLTAHKAEIQARGIRVVCEFESPFQIVESAAVHAAGKRLFQFVFSTVPDGCEVFIAAARKIASVAALESGSLTLRWQTTGNEGRVDRGSVAPLRPIPGVRGFIAIPAGIARMSVWKFALFTFVGALPWTFGLALGGFLLGANYEDIRSATRPFDIPIILAILGLAGWFVWHRVREIRADSREMALEATSLDTDE